VKTTTRLRIGAQIAAARLSGRARPFFVQYSLLNGCNARCVYCDLPNRPDPQLSTAEHRQILAEFARLGAVRIKFLGGEPLLRPDLGELIETVRAFGMRCAMVTNGFLIPRRLDLVRRLDELVISLDGREEAHDRQRGLGTWKRVMAGIDVCAAEGLDFFITAVLTRENLGEVDWLLDTASRLGVMVNFQLVCSQEALYQSAQAWTAGDAGTRAVLRKILAAKAAGAPVLFSPRSYRKTLSWPDYSVERVVRPGQRSPCTAGRFFLHLEPNGDLYPCFMHVGSFEPKNALRDGVAEAWRHAQRHSCFDCPNTWLNENRAIFSLQPAVLGNFWRNYLRPRQPRSAQSPGTDQVADEGQSHPRPAHAERRLG
jgi:MoaA/NifB/PqqE/SkfB family radical SAM enzyme